MSKIVHAPGVPQTKFLELVDQLRAEKGIRSDRSLCLKADVGIDFIRDLRRRGGAISAEKIAKIARVLGVPVKRLVDTVDKSATAVGEPIDLTSVFVRGDVQAGAWREGAEWPADQWYELKIPVNPHFKAAPRFALEVRGTSMDRVYKPGTIVIAVPFFDAGRDPRTGDTVVVLRRDSGGRAEATLKEYELDAAGRHILWPRSFDPEFQTPIILPDRELQIADVEGEVPNVAWNYALPDAGVPELEIFALVIGSYNHIN